MALVKCPRCELNYMNDTDTMCSVCRREVRGESEQFEMIELCSECGENPVVPGQELCAYCLKEQARRDAMESDDVIEDAPANIEIDGGGLGDEDFEDDADFSEDDDEEDEDVDDKAEDDDGFDDADSDDEEY